MANEKTKGIKKFFEEFKAFAMRGNVVDIPDLLVVSSPYTAIVNTLLNSDVVIQIGDVGIGVGAFLNAVLNFLIVAFVLFVVIKTMNSLHKKPAAPAAPKAPTTKVCPYCQTEIPIKAVRCPHCTSQLEE